MAVSMRIGTRKSTMALAQTEDIARRLSAAATDIAVEIVKFETVGDTDQTSRLLTHGGKGGAFVAEIRAATVVKGDNLWDLARHYYGDGLRYADIYHANENQIRNPNLIFIGQVFVVPQPETKTQ